MEETMQSPQPTIYRCLNETVLTPMVIHGIKQNKNSATIFSNLFNRNKNQFPRSILLNSVPSGPGAHTLPSTTQAGSHHAAPTDSTSPILEIGF